MTPAIQSRSPVRTPASDAGFTLAEVLVALIVFAIGVLSLAALMPLGTNRVSRAGSQTNASSAAAAAAERLLQTPYLDSSITAGNHTDDGNNPYPPNIWVEWNVEDDQPITDCKRITIIAHWPNIASTRTAQLVIVVPHSGG
jgi:prepilin-type N-terminal cleavage/methylation domain-containing protein